MRKGFVPIVSTKSEGARRDAIFVHHTVAKRALVARNVARLYPMKKAQVTQSAKTAGADRPALITRVVRRSRRLARRLESVINR